MRFGYLCNFGITSSPTHHYQYDDVGNRTSVLDLGVTKSYGANSVNAYTSISGFAAPVHDANGNMNSGPLGVVGAASSALTYGKENNNLLSASGTQPTNFVYDALGRLVQFSYTENSVTKTEILTWAGWTLMTREIFTGNAVSESHRYTWGTDLSGTMEGAGGVGGLLAVERNISDSNTWDIRYTHADANGNIIALTNSSGNVSARYRYDAFGKVLSATDVDASGWVNHNIHGFSSKPSFGNQGLLYYGYRWYSPSLGRWINRDPIEENGGVNLYGFVGNDGVNALDLLGLNGITTGFPTADAAGTAGTLAAVLLTQSRKPFGAEWCGQVCKKGCDFAYSQPVMGTDPKDLKGTIYNGLCNPSKSKCPDGWSSVGFYHSHPYGPDFNKTDLDAAAGYQNMYVGGAGTDKDEPGDIEILKFTRDDAMKIYKSLKPGQDIVVVYPLLEELIDEHTKSLGKFPPQLHPIK